MPLILGYNSLRKYDAKKPSTPFPKQFANKARLKLRRTVYEFDDEKRLVKKHIGVGALSKKLNVTTNHLRISIKRGTILNGNYYSYFSVIF